MCQMCEQKVVSLVKCATGRLLSPEQLVYWKQEQRSFLRQLLWSWSSWSKRTWMLVEAQGIVGECMKVWCMIG